MCMPACVCAHATESSSSKGGGKGDLPSPFVRACICVMTVQTELVLFPPLHDCLHPGLLWTILITLTSPAKLLPPHSEQHASLKPVTGVRTQTPQSVLLPTAYLVASFLYLVHPLSFRPGKICGKYCWMNFEHMEGI